MNPPKCDEVDYIHFLFAAQKVFSNTEAARCYPAAETGGPAHDVYMRLLYRVQAEWFEAKAAIIREAIWSYLSQPLYTLPSTA